MGCCPMGARILCRLGLKPRTRLAPSESEISGWLMVHSTYAHRTTHVSFMKGGIFWERTIFSCVLAPQSRQPANCGFDFFTLKDTLMNKLLVNKTQFYEVFIFFIKSIIFYQYIWNLTEKITNFSTFLIKDQYFLLLGLSLLTPRFLSLASVAINKLTSKKGWVRWIRVFASFRVCL